MSDKDHHGLTSELAAARVGLFNAVLIASRRVRELKNGHAPLVRPDRHGINITALREIEEGKIGSEYLYKTPEVNTKNSRQGR